MKKMLHVGCNIARISDTTNGYNDGSWVETRFDIDPKVEPDILGDMLDMNGIESEQYDSVFSSHNIEHFYIHQVAAVLSSFYRVIKETGFLIIVCPDLEVASSYVIDGKLFDPVYESVSGLVAPIDIIYGWRPQLALGNDYMAHKTGFTPSSLSDALLAAGFSSVVMKRGPCVSLWAVASKGELSVEDLHILAQKHFP